MYQRALLSHERVAAEGEPRQCFQIVETFTAASVRLPWRVLISSAAIGERGTLGPALLNDVVDEGSQPLGGSAGGLLYRSHVDLCGPRRIDPGQLADPLAALHGDRRSLRVALLLGPLFEGGLEILHKGHLVLLLAAQRPFVKLRQMPHVSRLDGLERDAKAPGDRVQVSPS